jgi:tRNA modification GTPase
MSFNTDDTICAIATAPGGAARGVIRVSGRNAVEIAASLFEPNGEEAVEQIKTARALRGGARFVVDDSARMLPCDLFVWPTNLSYTREPVAEFHTIGSTSVLGALLNAVCANGARLAEPGEFTLRAFLAGRLDLTQAEAVLGVIDARDSDDLATSLSQLAGGLAGPLDQVRDKLLQLLAELEAGLDFVDEDIEFISQNELRDRLSLAGKSLEEISERMSSRHVSSDRMKVVLIGPPNAGKSSLFNAMLQRFGARADLRSNIAESALVSSIRGTTRDYLTATITLKGIQCDLVDTAGIVNSVDAHPNSALPDVQFPTSIDTVAQALTREQRNNAAIRVYCVETSRLAATEWDFDSVDDVGTAGFDLLVCTKLDESTSTLPGVKVADRFTTVFTSSRTGQGLDELCEALGQLLSREESANRGQVVAATANRCRESVRLARESLGRAIELITLGSGGELVAVELRAALEDIGCVVGAIYTNDLLDRIFGTFCIGK